LDLCAWREGIVLDYWSDFNITLKTSDDMKASTEFNTFEGAQKDFDKQKFEKVIQEMKLRYVTATDILALILTVQDEPEDEEDG
jgi:hypothetical protein